MAPEELAPIAGLTSADVEIAFGEIDRMFREFARREHVPGAAWGVMLMSAFTVALTTNLEPVYGIILAWIFFGAQEQMSVGFYLGACIVLGTVFSYPYVKKWYQTRHYSRKIEQLKS